MFVLKKITMTQS